MRQVLQSLRTGATEVADVPAPAVQPRKVLIRTTRTLISAGTERMLVDFGKANWLDKARQQPDKVRMVLDKVRTDGLLPTIDTVRNKLDQPLPLGYCNIGIVVDVGPGVSTFVAGDRVVSNGRHAEIVSVGANLCAKVPDAVDDESAAFAVIGAIALQGIRLVAPALGETVAVFGLGLIGLMAAQLLRAHGCRVLGLDFDPRKLALAREFGAEVVDLSTGVDPVPIAEAFARGRGVDAVVIAAATKSNDPMHQAALMSRKRGRVVLVGVTGLELARADFYEKELTFQVSCSYGPGRYDPSYEEQGVDYPIGFVRWTEQRNFEAVLDMMASGRLDVRPLVSHRFKIEEAQAAYDVVGGSEPSLGILLEYPTDAETPGDVMRSPTVQVTTQLAKPAGAMDVDFIGAGNYAGAVLIPAFKAAGVRIGTVASSGGVSGLRVARKFNARETTTDTRAIFTSSPADAIVITTRHDSHASLVCDSLQAGKHVFVEKPLAITLPEVAQVQAALSQRSQSGSGPILMVGFNRRFAPQVEKMRALLGVVAQPKVFIMTVNAGAIPRAHWTQDADVGGGRIIGEACHFIDLLRFLAGAPVVGFDAVSMAGNAEVESGEDKCTITLRFANGSFGTVHYLANGNKGFPKERLEVFAGGRILRLDNFRVLTGYGWPHFRRMKLWRQDKGQRACVAAFVSAVQQGLPSPIPPDELFEVAKLTIDVAAALRGPAASGRAVLR